MQSRPIFNTSTRFEDMRNFDDERAPLRRPSGKIGSSALQNSNGLKKELHFQKESTNPANGTSNGNPGDLGMPVEDIAAIRIQSAFRAYKHIFVGVLKQFLMGLQVQLNKLGNPQLRL